MVHMERAYTGIVLAGGASRRMGRNKAFLRVGRRRLIEVVIERLREACTEVLVTTGDVAAYGGLGVAVVADRFPGIGVLGGLHAGLAAARNDLVLAVGCDMPFLNARLLRAFGEWAVGYDAAVLRHGAYVEPLHAAYRRTCLEPIERAIRAGQRRVISFFGEVRVRYVTPEEVRPLDPDLLSFTNLNSPEDWPAMARRIRRQG
jgi:molybdopterin-guanine dinucleotide biosynthesis protein A